MNDSPETEFESEFELTAHELSIIGRFIIGINTPAFQAAIFGRVRTGHDYSKDQRRLVSKALREINQECEFELDEGGVGYVSNPAGIVYVAPSLVLVLSLGLLRLRVVFLVVRPGRGIRSVDRRLHGRDLPRPPARRGTPNSAGGEEP